VSDAKVDATIAALLPDGAEPRTIAELWATVDADRAIRDLGRSAERLADDPLLGASIRLVRDETGVAIAIAEPATEGRLAATLARFGEGPAGRYVRATDGIGAVVRRAATAQIRLSRAAGGPFGRAVLVLGGPAEGRHLILVERPAGTIDR
jgi:anti-sigma factor RsiW